MGKINQAFIKRFSDSSLRGPACPAKGWTGGDEAILWRDCFPPEADQAVPDTQHFLNRVRNDEVGSICFKSAETYG